MNLDSNTEGSDSPSNLGLGCLEDVTPVYRSLCEPLGQESLPQSVNITEQPVPFHYSPYKWASIAVGPDSMELACPNCGCRIKTDVNHRATTLTHIACLLMSWTLCCCCLPYYMDTCRNTVHTCPNCDAFIGTYA